MGSIHSEHAMRDLKFAIRQLWNQPGFTAAAGLTLALGIGANTAVFSVMKRVLLHPPPWRDPQRLVTLWESAPAKGYEMNTVGPATYLDWKSQSRSFESMGAFSFEQELNLTGQGEPQSVIAVAVTANLLGVLGVEPVLGRGFAPEEETVGRDQVVLISHALWQGWYQADPHVIGQTLGLDGQRRTIVGVLPAGFAFPGRTGVLYGFFHNKPADLWVPLAWPTERWLERSNHELQVLGRLKPRVSRREASAELDGLMAKIAAAFSGHLVGTQVHLVGLHDHSVAHIRQGLALLLGAAALVLIIACANLINLFLVRATRRRLEFGIRLALGARRRQLLAQLLTESLLLALVGGALGILLAHGTIALLVPWVGDSIAQTTPGWGQFQLDGGVLAFTLVLSVSVGVVCGLMPYGQVLRADLVETVQGGTRGSLEGAPRHAFRRGLVAVQIALAVTLVMVAGLLLQSLGRLHAIDPGFDPRQVLALTLNLPESTYTNDQQRASFTHRLEERLRALPGVQSVGTTTQLPLSGDLGNTVFGIVGQDPLPLEKRPMADLIGMTPDYLKSMRIGLAAGRPLDDQDTSGTPKVCLVNQTLVKRHLANQNPIGQNLQFGTENAVAEVVGVVQDILQRRLDQDALPPAIQALLGSQIYLAYAQWGVWPRVSMVIKTAARDPGLTGAVRAEVKALDTHLSISRLQWMESVRGNSIAQPRLRAWLVGLLGGLALGLAGLGTYSVTAYATACRTHEMGVRLALGGRPWDVLMLVMRQGMRAVWIGLALGLAGTLALARLLTSVLYHTSPTDPRWFLGVAAVVTLTALLACYWPARRASKIQPMEALRYE